MVIGWGWSMTLVGLGAVLAQGSFPRGRGLRGHQRSATLSQGLQVVQWGHILDALG